MRTEYCRTHIVGDIDKFVEEGCISCETGKELKRDQVFRDEHKEIDLSTVSTKTLLPLRRERDKEVQANVIAVYESSSPAIRKMNFGTEQKMKTAIIRERRKLDKVEHVENLKSIPEGKYRTILLDPPWQFYGEVVDGKTIQGDYADMALKEIEDINPQQYLTDDALIFLWTIDKYYCEAKQMLTKWGLTYRFTIIWDKKFWFHSIFCKWQHEYLLVGVKGKGKPKENVPTVLSEQKKGHSEKPEGSYKLIEKISEQPRLELFARVKRDGWVTQL